MPTFTVAIKGTKFRPPEAREVARNLSPHQVVTLVPDPENEFDSNAIKIMVKDQFIGFVQKDMAAVLAARIDGEAVGYVSENADPNSGLYLVEVTVP